MVYPKFFNHLEHSQYPIGKAINAATTTIFTNSLESIFTILSTLEPKILRIPISFVLLSALNVASPKSPRHEMIIAKTAKKSEI